ncbi:MAG: class I SAM-dependent methyltransferase [Chloroflexota bacterium]
MNFDADYGRIYETFSQRSIPGYDLIFDLANHFLAESLTESADILVIGAGGGKEIVTFGSAHPGWRFVGVDPAAQMIAFAQSKAEQHGLSDRVQLIQGFAQDVPTDSLFDAATCILVFPFVHGDEAKLATLKAISEHLKPGAPFVIVTTCEETFRDDYRAIWRARQIERGATPEMVAKAQQDVFASIQPVAAARLLELMSEAGFSDAVPFYRAIWFAGWFVWKKKD